MTDRQNSILTAALAADSPGKTVEAYISEHVGKVVKDSSRRFPTPDILRKLEQVRALREDLNAAESVGVDRAEALLT